MKKIVYLLVFLSSLISAFLDACPFRITNDGTLDLILIEDKSAPEKRYHVKANSEFEIPGAAPQTYVWVYVQDKVGANTFELKYGILEFECIKEGDPLPHLKFSEFKNWEEIKQKEQQSHVELEPNYEAEPIYMVFNHLIKFLKIILKNLKMYQENLLFQ